MSYLDKIRQCNRYDLSHFKPLQIDQQRIGWVKHSFAEALKPWPAVFKVTENQVALAIASDDNASDFEAGSQALGEINRHLVDAGMIKHTHGEQYPVKTLFEQPARLLIDRAAAPYYGIRAWGQHLNGYVKKNHRIYIWVATRSKTKGTFPGKLDNLVAGGLPYGITLNNNIAKECREEASVPDELIHRLYPVGAISYCVEIDDGLKPDIMFCYDLELPESFIPVCQDGEVERFDLLPIEEVAQIVRDTDRFKQNCNLVIIDFLIRHGHIRPEQEGYLELVRGLRQPFDFFDAI